MTLSMILSYKIKNPGAQATRGHRDSRSQWDDNIKYILFRQIVKQIFIQNLIKQIVVKNVANLMPNNPCKNADAPAAGLPFRVHLLRTKPALIYIFSLRTLPLPHFHVGLLCGQ